MADFGGPEDVIRWIEAGPVATRRHCATVLASRAALRVWPVLVRELDQVSERRFGELRLAGARANAVAWATAKFPARASDLRAAAAAADAAALVADATGAVVVAAAAATASNAASAAHAAAQAADTAEELREQQEAAAGAGEDLAGKQQANHARSTYGNFFAELLLFAYRLVRTAPSVARGEGGFVSREYVGGVYKAAGAATFGAVVVGAAAAVSWTPQTIDFVLSNLDQKQAYCAVAFEHAPGAAQLLRWLEANAARTPRDAQH